MLTRPYQTREKNYARRMGGANGMRCGPGYDQSDDVRMVAMRLLVTTQGEGRFATHVMDLFFGDTFMQRNWWQLCVFFCTMNSASDVYSGVVYRRGGSRQ